MFTLSRGLVEPIASNTLARVHLILVDRESSLSAFPRYGNPQQKVWVAPLRTAEAVELVQEYLARVWPTLFGDRAEEAKWKEFRTEFIAWATAVRDQNGERGVLDLDNLYAAAMRCRGAADLPSDNLERIR